MSSTESESARKLETKEQKIAKICRGLVLDLKSAIPKIEDAEHGYCLIKFHNCTPYRIKPYWIDFKGLSIAYPSLQRGASINIDTYVSQLWYFKSIKSSLNRTAKFTKRDCIEIIAVPEEALDSPRMANRFGLTPESQQEGSAPTSPSNRHATLPNSALVCALCQDIFKRYNKTPNRVPCLHFTGETRLSVSDLERKCRSDYDLFGTRIFSCTEDTHRQEHSTNRRNIYLVESFQDLRERCFLMLRNRINHPDIVDLNLPTSLQQDFLQFISSMQKVEDPLNKTT